MLNGLTDSKKTAASAPGGMDRRRQRPPELYGKLHFITIGRLIVNV
jgi:hypothetical protein